MFRSNVLPPIKFGKSQKKFIINNELCARNFEPPTPCVGKVIEDVIARKFYFFLRDHKNFTKFYEPALQLVFVIFL